MNSCFNFLVVFYCLQLPEFPARNKSFQYAQYMVYSECIDYYLYKLKSTNIANYFYFYN